MRLCSKSDLMTPAGRRWRPTLAAFSTLLGLGMVVLAISPANAVPDLAGAFKHLDVDSDGILTRDEFEGATSFDVPSPAASATQSVIKPLDDISTQQDVVFLVGESPTRSSVGFMAKVPHDDATFVGSVGDAMRAEFAHLDADSDSQVSFAEFVDRHRTMMAELFDATDRNWDGYADATELGLANIDGSTPTEFVSGMDVNYDGRLSRLEFIHQ